MARRAGALETPAPSASLALALSFLIALAVLLPARADSAKSSKPAKSSEPAALLPVAPVPASEPAPAKPVNPRQAERLAKRRERAGTQPGPAAGEPGATPLAPAAAEDHAGATHQGNTHRRGGSRRPGPGAERTTGRGGGEAGSGESQNAATGVAQPQSLSPKAKAKKEREREERRSEREERRQRNGHENRREREAREAEEARAAETPAHVPVQTPEASLVSAAAVTAAAASATTAATTTTPSTPTIVGEHAVESTISRRAAARRRHNTARSHGAVSAGAALTSAVLGPAASPASRSTPTHGKPAARHAAKAHKSSPLVTTVTRIIGVIPTSLWLLIAALALAAAAFATTSRLSARRARRLDRQRRGLLEDVGLLQAALLPELPERVGPVRTTASYRPASGPGAGGDFYDVFALEEGKIAVIVGDVSGHGRDALPHTTLLRYTLRTYLEADLSPREALRAAAPALERQLGGSFATVVLATFDPRERLLTYACAGHPHPLLTGMAHDAPIIACSAPPIGAGRPTGTRQTVVMVPGATVACFYTDGVIEARTGGELYGQGRLAGALDGLGAEPTAASLLDSVRDGTDRRPDDMAACLLGISGGEGSPEIVSEQIELDGREAGRNRTRRFLLAAGVPEQRVAEVLDSARAIAADHGSALLELKLGDGPLHMTLTHDNIAPLRARALARTQEVAL
jgi:serine phosphatase RsbU (regulator of sigma subunit)